MLNGTLAALTQNRHSSQLSSLIHPRNGHLRRLPHPLQQGRGSVARSQAYWSSCRPHTYATPAHVMLCSETMRTKCRKSGSEFGIRSPIPGSLEVALQRVISKLLSASTLEHSCCMSLHDPLQGMPAKHGPVPLETQTGLHHVSSGRSCHGQVRAARGTHGLHQVPCHTRVSVNNESKRALLSRRVR